MLSEEKVSQQKLFDKRFNDAVKEFVQLQKDLVDMFNGYKQWVRMEVKTHECIRDKQQAIINQYHTELTELKNILKLPRQHFKFTDDYRYDQLMKEKEAVMEKLQKAFEKEQATQG